MKKQLLAVVFASGALSSLAQSAPTLTCSSLTSELNTGTSGGAQLGFFQMDPIWSTFKEYTATAQTPPLGTAAWTQARTTGSLAGDWATFSDAQWLSPGFQDVRDASALNQSWFGNWWPRPDPSPVPTYNYYRVQFNLSPEVPPSAVSLELEYMGDDAVHAGYVNGTAVVPFQQAGFKGGVFTTLNSGWVAGANSLIFTTSDTGWAAGLLARAKTVGQSICSASPVRITKTSDKANYQPGDTATYQVTVTSLGLVDATGVTLSDAIPAGLSNPAWSCSTASGAAVCPNPVDPGASFDLPGQSSLVFTLTGKVTGRATLNNIATVSPGVGGVCAADTGCSASVAPTYAAAQTSPIGITKTANQSNYVQGDAVQYDITVTNEWTVNATGLTLSDTVPAGLSDPVWSCRSAAGAAVCPSPVTPGTPFDLPSGSSLVFTLKGTATAKASLANTATISPGTGGECSASTGCSAAVSPTYTPVSIPTPTTRDVPTPVPTLGAGSLGALSLSLGVLAWRRKKRESKQREK